MKIEEVTYEATATISWKIFVSLSSKKGEIGFLCMKKEEYKERAGRSDVESVLDEAKVRSDGGYEGRYGGGERDRYENQLGRRG